MTSAIELVDDPGLAIDDVTASAANSRKYYTQDELRVFNIGEDDIRDLVLKVYNAGTKLGSGEIVIAGEGLGKRIYKDDIQSVVLDCTIEDSIDATPTVTLELFDPDWELLNTGCLDHTIDINPGNTPHRWYRLLTVAPNDDNLTLTFITRNAAYLSYHTRPYKVSRNHMTRAQFIKTLLGHVKKKGVNIKMYCPELRKKQPIAKTKPASKRSTNARRGAGFADGVKLKFTGNDGSVHSMTEHDIKAADDALNAAEQKNASPRAMVGMIMVMSIETDFGRSHNSKYVGYFQQDPRWWPATGDAYKDAFGARGKHGFLDVFVPLVRKNPNADLGELCHQAQGAGDPLYGMKCDRARPNAEKIVEAWTGGLGADDTSYAKSFEFMIGPPDGPRGENYLEAMYRLAEPVNWSAYWVGDVLHFISQEDLFKSKARARVRYHRTGHEFPSAADNGGVSIVAEHVSATWDRGRPVQEMTISVRMSNWAAPIGTVVVFDEGGPLRGRWLIANIRKSVFSTTGEIVLRKPLKEKKEPAHEMKNRPTDGGDSSPVDPGDIEGTPKDIIDTVVIPIANSISDKFMAGGGQGSLTPQHVQYANLGPPGHPELGHGHTITGGRSDHEGPPWYAWAADMSDNWGSSHGSPKMDQLAAELGRIFHVSPHRGGCFSHQTKRYRFQICYMTTVGGNHFNHVHFGVLDLHASPTTPPTYSPKQSHGGPARD